MSGELRPSEVVDVLSPDAETAKRAEWEAFEFTLLGDGEIEVVNTSHEEPEEHTYTVHVEGGIPSDCTCPAFEYREGSCKHQVAVAIREPVLEAATAEPTMKADGGLVEAEESDHSDERPDDCDCGEWNQGLGLSCWPCYRDGFEEPNQNVGEDE